MLQKRLKTTLIFIFEAEQKGLYQNIGKDILLTD